MPGGLLIFHDIFPDYKYAYHQNCIGCHKEIKVQRKRLESVYLAAKKELPKTGPTSCNECHPKE